MATAQITYYLKSASFNGTTYDLTSGGTKRLELSVSGTELNEWAGDAFWALLAASVNGRVQARVFLTDVKQTSPAPNTKSSLVCVLEGKAANTTITLANMVYIGLEQINQGRAQTAEGAMVFGHESADGTTFPMS